MSLTYKNDNSFFTVVVPPYVHYGWPVREWLIKNTISKFRYIRDSESELDFWSLQQNNQYYPETKTIGIVANPYLRAVLCYKHFCKVKNSDVILNSKLKKSDLEIFDLSSFKSFVGSLPKAEDTIGDYWFTAKTPLTVWFNDTENPITYLLKAETIQEDFQAIRDYFCSSDNLNINPLSDEYKDFYTTKTKKIIRNLFAEDFETFGYDSKML